MTAIIILYILGILIALIFSGFFSGFETAVLSANRLKLKNLELNGDMKAEEVLDLLKDAQKVIGVVLVGNSITIVLASLLSRELLILLIPKDILFLNLNYESLEQLINLIILTPIFLIFAEVLPKQIARLKANSVLMYFSWLFKFFAYFFIPIIHLINAIIYLILIPLGIKKREHIISLSKEDIKNIVKDGIKSEDEKTKQTEKEMIYGIFNLEKTRVCEIMRPLVSLAAVRLEEATIEGVLKLARETGHSRFPVFKERVINIIGYVDVYRIFSEGTEGKKLEDFIEEAPYVPEAKRIDDLLQEFIKNKTTVAIVVDEYGGCSGWLTRRDLLEEIVGEIKDEFIRKESLFKEIGNEVYEVGGVLDIDDLNEMIPIHLEKNYCETVGGYIYSALGRIPMLNERVYVKDYILEVTQMDKRKIVKVKITHVPKSDTT